MYTLTKFYMPIIEKYVSSFVYFGRGQPECDHPYLYPSV